MFLSRFGLWRLINPFVPNALSLARENIRKPFPGVEKGCIRKEWVNKFSLIFDKSLLVL